MCQLYLTFSFGLKGLAMVAQGNALGNWFALRNEPQRGCSTFLAVGPSRWGSVLNVTPYPRAGATLCPFHRIALSGLQSCFVASSTNEFEGLAAGEGWQEVGPGAPGGVGVTVTEDLVHHPEERRFDL